MAIAELSPRATRFGLIVTALAPVVPQILGSAFNIWYNAIVVQPLLVTPALRQRFAVTVIIYNGLVYPIAIAIWVRLVFSLNPIFRALINGEAVASHDLERARRRVIDLPWIGAVISGAAWLGCIPVFLISLATTDTPLSRQLLWHLPISFVVSAFIAVTQTFFLIELATHWALFLVFFRDSRPDRLRGIHPPSLRTRGLMWAISAGLCPIGSLLLLILAPHPTASNPQMFAIFVGIIGVAFGLCSAVLITRLVAKPVDELRAAFHAVGEGKLDVQIPLRRADEFGTLVGDFNQMVAELRDKERLRRIFGLHVGEGIAEQILARDPELGGVEQVITVMFLDIRGFTTRAAQ
ncbi:MAG TPA: HAMP domain-containing protein, partial [Chthoniobacterales bacterium]